MDPCFTAAKQVLKTNETRLGIRAGELYPDFWCRDGLISTIGLLFSEDESLINLAEKIINNISDYQKSNGQLPNKISQDGKMVCFGESGCVDSSLWYPITVLNHYKILKDKKFLAAHIKKIEKSIKWVLGLDINNDFLIETNEGSDWMDWLLRSGRVLYDNILFYTALKSANEVRSILDMNKKHSKTVEQIKNSINLFFWPKQENLRLIKKRFSFSGIDKDFEILLREGEKPYYFADVGFRRYDPRCDVYANILAVLFDVADNEKKRIILGYLEKEKVYDPYPVKVLVPPIYENDSFRPFYFRPSDFPDVQKPGYGQNGGIWPFVGGFYAAVLKKEKLGYEHVLKKLAEANLATSFNEWLDWNGKPSGSKNQSWSAAMYIFAYKFR